MNNATINMDVQKSLWHVALESFGYRSGVAESYHSYSFQIVFRNLFKIYLDVFLRNFPVIFIMATPVYMPPLWYMRVPVFQHPWQHLLLFVFLMVGFFLSCLVLFLTDWHYTSCVIDIQTLINELMFVHGIVYLLYFCLALSPKELKALRINRSP